MKGLPGTSALGGAMVDGLGRFFLQGADLDLGVMTQGGTHVKLDSFPAHEYDLIGPPAEGYLTPLAYFDLISPLDPLTAINVEGATGPATAGTAHTHTVAGDAELPFVWKPLEDGERVLVGWIGDPPNRQPVVISRILRMR